MNRNKNVELGRQVGKRIRSQAHACWRNAQQALLRGGLDKRSVYVDGYVIFDDVGIAIDHGWIEIDGVIVDPTIDRPGTYFKGAEYGRPEVAREFKHADGGAISWVHGGWNGLELDGMRQAFIEAYLTMGVAPEALVTFMRAEPEEVAQESGIKLADLNQRVVAMQNGLAQMGGSA